MKKHYYLTKLTPQYLKKNKKIDLFERSTLQLMSAMIRDEKKKQFPFHSKTHSALKEKKLFLFMLKTFIF